MSAGKSPSQATKVTEAEATSDPRQLLRLTKEMASSPEVKGQHPFPTPITCPGCGAYYRNIPHTDLVRYYACNFCGTYFRI
jgi:hypothetical protein